MRFAGRTIIVTGAGSGIGAATARRFAGEGAKVVLVGRTRQTLDDTRSSLEGGTGLVVTADVSVVDDAARMVEEATRAFGGVDVVVNNAGAVQMGTIDAVEPADFRKVTAIDVDGVYNVTRAAWAALKASGGNVINVSSVSGIGGDWGMFAYNAAKGAVSNMTRALALDFPKSGVRVNAVAPTMTHTNMTRGMKDDTALLDKFTERIPMGRAAEPEEIASVIAFLASADAGFVNGVVLPVDGGLSASNGQPPIG